MPRFNRDESRTFKLWWFVACGGFAAVSAWALYNDAVTRVPWQVQQKEFYAVELEQATKNVARVQAEFAAHTQAKYDALQKRHDELTDSQKGGEFYQWQQTYNGLSQQYGDAEQDKTFAKSDLDEAYYYRELAEYARDEAMNKARAAVAADPGGAEMVDKLFADPPPPDRAGVMQPGISPAQPATDAMYHLYVERDRNQRKADAIEAARPGIDAHVWTEFGAAADKLRAVVAQVDIEIEHEKKVDIAEKRMADIDGPADPAGAEKDEKVAFDKRKALCDGQPGAGMKTRHCVQWIRLDPVTNEVASLERTMAKQHRPVDDAKQRLDVAVLKANPKFEASPGKLINYLVGPYQIQQVVTAWNEAEADVEKEQVDRCPTCHMGADSANYTDPSIPRQFRTHPFRSTLFRSHPIEKFGCTSCHQGEGRATDSMAHSGFVFHPTEERPRWDLEGDKFWEDPLLPIGRLYRVQVDDRNNELQLRVDAKGSPGDWVTVHIAPGEYAGDTELLGAIQAGGVAAVGGDVAKSWRLVVRKTDARVVIGLEQTNPNEVIEDADKPTLRIKFTKPELAEALGFMLPGATGGGRDLYEHLPSYSATFAPSEPVRSDGEESWSPKGRYTPPTARKGLQVPPDYRDRFILAIPEGQSGCYRCHSLDTDLRPHDSKAKWIYAGLDAKKAAAEASRPTGRANETGNPDKAKADEEAKTEAEAGHFSEDDPDPTWTEGR